MTFNCSPYVLDVCRVMESPKDGSLASVSFWLVCMEFSAFHSKRFYDCFVCIRRFGLDFYLVVLEHFKLKSVRCDLNEKFTMWL